MNNVLFNVFFIPSAPVSELGIPAQQVEGRQTLFLACKRWEGSSVHGLVRLEPFFQTRATAFHVPTELVLGVLEADTRAAPGFAPQVT